MTETDHLRQGLALPSRRLGKAILLAAAIVSAPVCAQTYLKTETIAYENNTALWVLGQVKRVAVNGIEVSETTFNSKVQPETMSSFGKLQSTLTYNPDGTLSTFNDGSGVTTLLGWYRGIPTSVTYPVTDEALDGATISATVNPDGTIGSVTDEYQSTTSYGYDVMGRLSLIDYPNGDTVAWTSTTRNFSVQATKYGLPDHWRLLERTGDGYKITRYDALWRPVIEESYDNGNPNNTRSLVVKRYDEDGRLAFQSYPLRSLPSDDYRLVTSGTHTTYDALDRVTRVRQTSEQGDLDTTTQYLSGLTTRVIRPRHQGMSPAVYTETSHMAWNEPTLDFPVVITQPEGVGTDIARDIFGKPTAITRGSPGSTVTRSYVYNANQELCKSLELETGATLYGYDAAGNLAWSASGQPSDAACATGTTPPTAALQRAAQRTYDARNRLKTLRFSDTRGDQDWHYTRDGLPARVVTVNVPGAVHPENHYSYDKRRNLTSEVQFLPAWYSFAIGYKYNPNGHLERIHYPSADYVDFAPNSLGQPTRAEGAGGRMYASNVTYHADGSIAGFHYGNGVAYTMEQFTQRPIPKRVDSYGVQKYEYKYDANSNPENIFDQTRGNDYSRLLQYDALDRLTGVGSVSFGGSDHWHRFTYDALDNMVTWKHAGIRDSRYCYDTSNRLQFLRSAATTCSNGAATDYFQYDPQGNVEIHDGMAFDFDYGNRLREVIDVERYRYDAYGRRVLAMNFATGVLFSQYGQSGQLLYQNNTRTGQNKQVDHIYLGGSLIAQREQPVTPANGPVTVHYIHTDALGSPVAVTNATNPTTGTERMEYNPYGEQRATTATIGRDRPGYTGHVLDPASGLNYMQQRYYDPQIGRFLSVDPVTAYDQPIVAFNRYRYANNNPYKFTDPDGRAAFLAPVAVAAGRCAANAACRTAVTQGTKKVIRRIGAAIAGAGGAAEGMRQANESSDPPIADGGTSGESRPGASFPSEDTPVTAGGEPAPAEGAIGPHTTLGTRDGSKGPYPVAVEFDEEGRPVREINFTDHGRRDHPNPHQHPYTDNPTGGTRQRGDPEPVPELPPERRDR